MSGSSSYRTILRASSIIGGASVVRILSGLIKMKVAAVLLGPAGVGLVGLYQNLIQTAGGIAGLGLANSGVRQIASAKTDGDAAIARVTRLLFWAGMMQALLGGLLFWFASTQIATWFVADPSRATEVSWLALGVGLSVAAAAQSAVLQGLRRIGDIARIQVWSGILGAALGVLALWLWGAQGLLAMVLIAPAVNLVLSAFYVARLENSAISSESPPEMAREWLGMTRLGVSFMFAGLITTISFLLARTLIKRELGIDALGQFQAAWTIGMTYIGFVLGAMGTDYFPRLTAALKDHTAAVRLVNEQTEVGLLLCGPVIIAMLGFAPWVIWLLYSPEFAPAVDILRWQLLGDILKVISWPLGFILIATGSGKTFIFTQTLGMAVFLGILWVGLPSVGLTVTGMAYACIYLVGLPVNYFLSGGKIGFRWARPVKAQAALLVVAVLVVELAALQSDLLGAIAGFVLSSVLAVWALLRLASASGATGRLAPLARMGERLRQWIKQRS